MYLNEVTIIGNITRDPELKTLPSGTAVCSFSVATNHTYKDKNGTKQETVEYHNIVVFGRSAELVAQYMRKGSQILVKGRLQTRSWEQDGQKKYRTEIVADRVQFGNKPRGESSGAPRESAPASDSVEYPEDEINPDDIPF